LFFLFIARAISQSLWVQNAMLLMVMQCKPKVTNSYVLFLFFPCAAVQFVYFCITCDPTPLLPG